MVVLGFAVSGATGLLEGILHEHGGDLSTLPIMLSTTAYDAGSFYYMTRTQTDRHPFALGHPILARMTTFGVSATCSAVANSVAYGALYLVGRGIGRITS